MNTVCVCVGVGVGGWVGRCAYARVSRTMPALGKTDRWLLP